jgi:heptosyltransferase-1
VRILIVRTSALGDVVHALPVLRALRRAHPDAHIAWAVEESFAPLLAGHPDLDSVVPVRLRAWRRSLLGGAARREMGAAWRSLRRFAPDVALDLMGNHKAGALARLSGARRVIGPARRDRREPSSAVWMSEGVALAGEHAVDRMLGVLAPLGVAPAPVDFGGEALLRPAPPEASAFLDGRAPYVLILPAAGWGNKVYPPARWGEVARRLRAAAGLDAWVPFAPGEEPLARAVAVASRGAARAVDAAAFPFLAALIRGSRLVLGGDTGPLHLAQALGAPVVCVMGPTDPRRNGPYGAPERALHRRLPCSFCYKRFGEVKACLLQLSPAAVADRGLELLAAEGWSRPPSVSE